MLDNNISVEGDKNVVFNNVKNSTIHITESNDMINSLKGVYDVIIEETNIVDAFVLCVLNRGGIDWFGDGENRKELYQSIESINRFIEQNRFFFSEDFYVEVSSYYVLATNLRIALEQLVMAIATADNQDVITEVYNITYEQDIHCCAEFVRGMMNAFNKADNHPEYNDFANAYELHEQQRGKILSIIESKRETIV